ncbi:hypothetical protein [Stigmatella erecta]|uniref:Uncharacterized protein n=1 Tax=Stigmatella erecta TaxID=83460 RepID=A0A1I0KC43_9BACT|nr:hypothetical protein [Stigmatella erecta]SEU21843.1 hypothetical protein SAMN05443639_11057 [Stigmatella erecta]
MSKQGTKRSSVQEKQQHPSAPIFNAPQSIVSSTTSPSTTIIVSGDNVRREIVITQETIVGVRRAFLSLSVSAVCLYFAMRANDWGSSTTVALVLFVGTSGALLLGFGFASLLEMYLSGKFAASPASIAYNNKKQNLGMPEDVADSEKFRLRNAAQELGSLSSQQPSALNVDVDSMADAVAKAISERIGPRALAGEEPDSRAPAVRHYSVAQEHIKFARIRLQKEIDTIQRRGNSNLILGILTTMVAVALLLWIAVSLIVPTEGDTNAYAYWAILLYTLLPKFFIALFIEIFSFFFLRLYRSSVQETKYFQNELTNLDSRAIAVEMALLSSDKEAVIALASELSRTERNFVLKKEESTVELEVAKAEVRGLREVMVAMSNLLRPERPKST